MGAPMLLAIAGIKIFTTSLTIGSGSPGGVFGPSMVIGGCFSAGVGLLVQSQFPDLVPHPEAFAASFAAGDMKAFSGFLHQDAVFMGGSTPLRGREAILERWTRMRGEGEPTFSWRPERVAVQGNGELALSTGPVLAPDGTWFSSFVSTWKKTAEGWRIVLDVGPRCPPPKAPPEEPSQP